MLPSGCIRAVREQWHLYLRLTPHAFHCASKEKGPRRERTKQPYPSDVTSGPWRAIIDLLTMDTVGWGPRGDSGPGRGRAA